MTRNHLVAPGLLRAVVGLALALGGLGCGGPLKARSGASAESLVTPELATCEERRRPLPPDVVTPLGFTAADVLAFSEGEHRQPLVWREVNEVDHAAEGRETELVINVSPGQGPTVFVDSQAVRDPSGASLAGIVCSDFVEIPVRVRAHTIDGTLKVSFAAVLRAQHGQAAVLHHRQQLDNHEGSLRITDRRPKSLIAKDFYFDVGFKPDGMGLLMRGVYEARQGGTAMASYVDFACSPQPPAGTGQAGDLLVFPGCQM